MEYSFGSDQEVGGSKLRNNNFKVGLGLIFLGLAYFLRNFNVSMISTLMILGGLYFFYSYKTNKHQPHLVFGIVLTAAGALVLLRIYI